MNPTVAAAAIGVGGTVIVGVAGFWASVRNISRTIRYARESRLWDRRADLYIETLAALNYRENRRWHEVHASGADQDPDPEERQRIEAYLAAHRPPDWSDLVIRLYALAAGPVVTAVEASRKADYEAISRYHSWRRLETELSAPSEDGAGAPDEAATAAAVVLSDALVAAEKADDEVLRVTRTELQSRGGLLGRWLPESNR